MVLLQPQFSILQGGQEASLSYHFFPDPNLPPREFQVSPSESTTFQQYHDPPKLVVPLTACHRSPLAAIE
jgi:hypothetical protein